MDKEYIIVSIVLGLLSLGYIYLYIIRLFYLRKKESFEKDLEIYNDKLDDIRKNITFSFKLCKIINVVSVLCFISLIFSIYYLNKEFFSQNEYVDIISFYIIIGIYYAPLGIMTNYLLFTLITIAIALYFRCDKKIFKKYMKVIYALGILEIVLIISVCILKNI